MFQNIYKVLARSSAFDERRTRYTIYVSWVIIPVVFLFPLINDYTGLLASVILGLIGVILVANLVVYSTRWTWGQEKIPYLGVTVAMGSLLYFTYLGYGDGASAMWIFIFPLLAMFMIGALWGSIGSFLTLFGAIYIMSIGGETAGFNYSYKFTLRFAVSFSMVTALAFGFEYWRVSLELQKDAIDQELSRTRDVLAGLTNVCSWCNSIKAPDNSWVSLETYVSSKEETSVSHSICPDCAEKEQARLISK